MRRGPGVHVKVARVSKLKLEPGNALKLPRSAAFSRRRAWLLLHLIIWSDCGISALRDSYTDAQAGVCQANCLVSLFCIGLLFLFSRFSNHSVYGRKSAGPENEVHA